MSKPTTAVMDRWNDKAYDDLRVRNPKGRRADVEAYARAQGEAVNGLINHFLRDALGMTEEDWKQSPDSSAAAGR